VRIVRASSRVIAPAPTAVSRPSARRRTSVITSPREPILGDAVGHDAGDRPLDDQRLDDQPDGQTSSAGDHGQDERVGAVIAGQGVQAAGITARTCDRLATAEHVPDGAKDEDDQ
jgi:hypothetical protein